VYDGHISAMELDPNGDRVAVWVQLSGDVSKLEDGAHLSISFP
jgi:hypothetical protein